MAREKKADWELWERVKRTTVPLNSNRANKDFASSFDTEMISAQKETITKPVPSRVVKPYKPEPQIKVSLASKPSLLDEATGRKIAKGKTSIDARLDLHGMTQAEAYQQLFRFVDVAFVNGKRTLLVITGKGVRGEGVLRNAVPRWLSEPVFQRMVVGFRESHITHGGAGALYVRLRNRKRERDE